MREKTENLKRELERLIDEGKVLSSPPIVKKALELEGVIWKR